MDSDPRHQDEGIKSMETSNIAKYYINQVGERFVSGHFVCRVSIAAPAQPLAHCCVYCAHRSTSPGFMGEWLRLSPTTLVR
jgi:hypothetical protein